MSLIIKSGATSDLLTVDVTSKAARVTLYGVGGSPITSLPVTPTPPSDVISTGTISVPAGTVAVVTQGASTVVFNVTGTWSGTLQPQVQLADNSWVNANVFPTLPFGPSVSAITANGQWKINVGGFQNFRLLATAFTSGTAAINLEASAGQTFIQTMLYGSTGNVLDGTAGSPSTGVLSVQGVVGGTAVPVSFSGNTTVVGAAASGSAVSGNPVLTAGSDGTNARTISTDSSGQVKVLVQNTPSVTITSGTVSATQGTSPWVVSLTSTTITGTVAVTQSTSPWVTAGTLTHNNAAPTANNVGVLPAVASSAAPTYTAGDQVLLSTDLAGNQRVIDIASAPTGSAVPADANYVGFNSGGNLVGVASANPLPTTLTGNITTFSLSAPGQTAVVNMLNLVNAAVVLPASNTWTGTLVTEVSIDNGVTWQQVDVWDEVLESYINSVGEITANGSYWFEPIGAIWFARVRLVTLTSGGPVAGTLIGTIAPNLNLEYTGVAGSVLPNNLAAIGGSDGTNIQPVQLVAKGAQPSATSGFVATMEAKDAGRTYITIYADRIAGITTEALITTLDVNKAGTQTTGVTSYTVTAGKTFRIQSLYVEVLNTTTVVNRVLVRVRVNSSGAAVLASPVVLANLASGAAALAAAGGNQTLAVSDGLEIPAGSGIGISQLCSVTTAGIVTVALVGYEY